MIDGESPRWRRRVLLNVAENLARELPDEAEVLVAEFPPMERSFIRREIDRILVSDADFRAAHREILPQRELRQ